MFSGYDTVVTAQKTYGYVSDEDDLLTTISARDLIDALSGDGFTPLFVDLDGDFYKLVGDFDKRFPEGAPSLKEASSLSIEGDWTFGRGVRVVGDVTLNAKAAQRVEGGAVLSEDKDD